LTGRAGEPRIQEKNGFPRERLSMAVFIKRVYDPPAPEDGFRLLIMRLWPRGIKKTRVSAWEKELGPSRELLTGFLKKTVDWPEYVKRYRAEMKKKPELLRTWAARARKEDLTLLCGCKDENHCHRSLLRELLQKEGAD
jgi:uncharacterized protein YeaO (DUF488 family)